jgi:hypothetical protein
MTSTTQYFKKSMNALYEIDDGNGTNISNGAITTNSLTTTNFNATNLTCNSITASTGNVTTLNTTTGNIYSIQGLANISSINSTYWRLGGLIFRPFQSGPSYGPWFSMNYDDNSMAERNGLMIDVSNSNGVNLTVDDPLTFNIYQNGIPQMSLLNSTGFQFNNKVYIPNTLTATTGTIQTLNSTTATVGTLNLTTLNLSSATIPTLNTTTLTATNATIPTLTSTNATFTNATFTNTITVPAINSSYSNFQNIQAVTPSTATNLYTTSTASVSLGGTGGVKIANDTLRFVEVTSQYATNKATLNFYSSGNVNYDSRIVSTAGTTTAGQGTLDITSGTINLNTSNPTGVNWLIKNGNLGLETGINTNFTYVDFHSSNATISDYDARISCSGGTTTAGQGILAMGANEIDLNAPTIKINTNSFRFVPWTTYYTGTSISGLVGAITTAPTCGTSALIKYRYSIVGNTMYINYYFNQTTTTGSAAGSGYYYYIPPTGFTYNTTDIVTSTTVANGNNGTKIGTSNFKHFGTDNGIGGVYWMNGSNVMLLWCELGATYNCQNSGVYSYNTPNLYVAFDAMIPIS